MVKDPAVQRCVDHYQLGLPRTPISGRSGELLGRGVGSSLEFQEYRQYTPGDDIRHLDWAAYARSDQLMVRLYREEISPKTQILVDVTRSMGVGADSKPLVTKQLAALFSMLSSRLGGQPQIIPLSDEVPLPVLSLDGLSQLYEKFSFQAVCSLAELLDRQAFPLRPQGLRVVISDFLFPHNPETLIRRLASGANVLWIVQVLTSFELNPTPIGGRRLVDVETGQELDLQIDQRRIAIYKERLSAVQRGLQTECRRVNSTFVTLESDQGLEALCRGPLSVSGILRSA